MGLLVPTFDSAALAGLGSMERVLEQIVGAPVPQTMKDFDDNVRHVPQEVVQKWEVEPIVGASVPQIWEPIVEGVQLAPQERVENRIPDPIVDIPVPQILGARVDYTTGTRAESHAEADCGCPCA